jgi:hypothetical protein
MVSASNDHIAATSDARADQQPLAVGGWRVAVALRRGIDALERAFDFSHRCE